MEDFEFILFIVAAIVLLGLMIFSVLMIEARIVNKEEKNQNILKCIY